MASVFDAADAAAQAATEACFGNQFEVTPRLPGGDFSGRQPDGSRPVRTVTGVLSVTANAKPVTGAVLGHDPVGPLQIAGEPTTLWVSAAAAALLGYVIQRGDAVRRADVTDAPVYTVTRVFETDMGDLLLDLAMENQP